ncbi:MAG: Txe/YoeB family addiction module toxin [Spirosomaceae bacterium]|jgi:toxin YoeB|nr:Txe/YoeB family addiction module toxin [Spirosomataceae bacterium]
MRSVRFREKAFDEVREWLFEDPKTLQRIFRVLEECRRTPFVGIGKPEALKGEYKGCWSRRINDEDRLIYKVTDEDIIVLSLKGHYQ